MWGDYSRTWKWDGNDFQPFLQSLTISVSHLFFIQLSGRSRALVKGRLETCIIYTYQKKKNRNPRKTELLNSAEKLQKNSQKCHKSLESRYRNSSHLDPPEKILNNKNNLWIHLQNFMWLHSNVSFPTNINSTNTYWTLRQVLMYFFVLMKVSVQ